jgi:hypothetical protein
MQCKYSSVCVTVSLFVCCFVCVFDHLSICVSLLLCVSCCQGCIRRAASHRVNTLEADRNEYIAYLETHVERANGAALEAQMLLIPDI